MTTRLHTFAPLDTSDPARNASMALFVEPAKHHDRMRGCRVRELLKVATARSTLLPIFRAAGQPRVRHVRESGRDPVKFRPLQDRVLIRRIEEEEKTAGGIIIPDTAKEKPMEGEVIAAGPGVRGDDGKLQPLDVKVGDRVLFGKWSGTEIKIDGEDFVVAKESDIMGVVEEAASRKGA